MMSELTDLEICKRIAEIECVKIKIDGGKAYLNQSASKSKNVITIGAIYNPLTDKALCFSLMVKHGINFSLWNGSYRSSCMWDVKDDCYYIDILDKNPQRAICLAIIKKSEAL